MREGRPDLRLFHQLFWIVVCSYLLAMYFVFPGASILQGTFPSETEAGRVCLLLPTASSAFYQSESYKLNMFRLFFPLLNTFVIIYLRFRVKRFTSELCPRNQMSCIGVYKRNVISLQTTIRWLMFWNIVLLLEYVFYTLLAVEGDYFSRQTVFWIWNVKGFFLNEGLHFALPALLEVPDSLERKKMGKNTFYVRKPGSLEPRRIEVKTAKSKTVEEAPSSLLLSARDLLQRRVPSKIIKVAEYRGQDLPNISWHNIEDKSLQNLKDSGREPEKLELSIQDAEDMPKRCRTKLEERVDSDNLELSIPRTNDGHLNRRKPCTVYCRNHNSFARY